MDPVASGPLRASPFRGVDDDDARGPLSPRPPPDPAATVPAERPRSPTVAARLIYISLALVPIVLGGIVLLVRTGVIVPSGASGAAPWDLSILLVSIATTLVMASVVSKRAPAALDRARGGGSDSGYAAWEFGAVVVSAPLALALAALAFALWAGWAPTPASLRGHPMVPPIVAAVAILVSTTPVAFFAHMRARHVRAMEERFPDLLRDLNESYSAGMTMPQAIRMASRGDYGRLNPEIRRMAHQIAWNTPFPQALEMFAHRVGTPLVTRAVSLIIKATRAGGNVKDVLAAAARDTREIKGIEADRRMGMTLYVVVIYVAFAVFLGVTAALQGLLIPSVIHSTQGLSNEAAGALAVGGAVTETDFRYIFFGIGIVQALGSGLAAGAMSEGRISAGLKHSAIMIAITAVVLGVLL